MCKGIGLDLCSIGRMEKLLQDDRFLRRYFTPGETDYVRSRGNGAAATLAGLFPFFRQHGRTYRRLPRIPLDLP